MWLNVWCRFFFKQKTAYEMRISDWSSDVCSSDLMDGLYVSETSAFKYVQAKNAKAIATWNRERSVLFPDLPTVFEQVKQIGRASCWERVCHTCRSRWSPYH